MDSKRKPWEFPDGAKLKRASSITWNIWSNMPLGPLWKVVALHCGMDPDAVTPGGLAIAFRPQSPEWFYQQRIDLACAHVRNETLECFERKDSVSQSDVRLPVYAAWAESLGAGHELPPQFPRSDVLPKASGVEQSNQVKYKWPWGNHDSKLLRDLAMAGEQWRLVADGGSFDPQDSSTAPKNDFMIQWLIEQGVRKENAKLITRIVHANGLPAGPRTRKKSVVGTTQRR